MREISIKSVKELDQFAQELIKEIPTGSIIFLNGEMGAGKTSFVQAFAKILGVKEPVRSPTFIIQSEYKHGMNSKLNHLDLYRLEKTSELTELNLEKLINPYSYTFIEWADKFEEQLKDIFATADLYKLDFEVIDENKRLIKLTQI